MQCHARDTEPFRACSYARFMADEFAARFNDALDSAAADAEQRLGGRLARTYKVAYGEPRARNLISVKAAAARLSAASPLMAPIIDVAVLRVEDDATVVFVRASGHNPVPWEGSLDPSGRGPFHLLLSDHVSDRRSPKLRESSVGPAPWYWQTFPS